MASYIAIIHKDKSSDYGVSFPDFPGCISAGSTLDEARAMGQEALEAYTDFLQEEGHGLPPPMSLEDAIKATYQEGIFATMVITLEGGKSKMERVNISVPSRDLAKIDRYAKSHGLTRSAFLIQAAQKVIQRGDPHP
jgi:predicted RNase H-like HicB family nuclease